MNPSVIKVEPMAGFRLWLRFDDGVEGVVDLSHLSDRGAFTRWRQPGVFEKAAVHPDWGTVFWPAGPSSWEFEIFISSVNLYRRLTTPAMHTHKKHGPQPGHGYP